MTCTIILDRPKTPDNTGTIFRSALALGADTVIVASPRWPLDRHPLHKLRTDPSKAVRHLDVRVAPTLSAACDMLPLDTEIVVIERALQSMRFYLDDFEHPETCAYVFGPEDGVVDWRSLRPPIIPVEIRAAHAPSDPRHSCLNLATAVSIVLYDRAAKVLSGVSP